MDVSTYLLSAFLSGLALLNLVQAQGQLGMYIYLKLILITACFFIESIN